MGEDNYYFYVLECKDGSYYAGYTTNIEKRVKKHNEGKGAKYTRARKPVQLIFSLVYKTKSEALKAEYQFKQLSRKEKDIFIENERRIAYVATEKL
jgi:putative endonuclease